MDFESFTTVAENSFCSELLLRVVPEVITSSSTNVSEFLSNSGAGAGGGGGGGGVHHHQGDFKTLETVDLNSNNCIEPLLPVPASTPEPASAAGPVTISIDESSNEKENELDDLTNLNPCDLISDWPNELDEYLQKGDFDIEDFLKFENQSQKNSANKTIIKKEYKKGRRRPGQVKITRTPDGSTIYCCPECNLAYTDSLILERHLTVHKADRRFICEVCGVAMKRKEHIQRHKLGHRDERPFTCAVCMKGFKRKEHHDIHFVIHSGEKSIFCPECNKGFYRRDHLTTHLKSHDRRKLRKQRREERLKLKRLQNKAKKKATKELVINISSNGDTQVIPVQIQKMKDGLPLPSFGEAFTVTEL